MWPWIIDWLIARAEWGVAGAVVACTAMNCTNNQHVQQNASTDPRPPIYGERSAAVQSDASGRRVLAEAKIEGDRCHLPGYANDVPVVWEIDTGDPIDGDFAKSWVGKLGLGNLQYEEIWPGTRYGKIADTTVDIRVGDWAISNAHARVYSNWRYTFGDDEDHPLLGLAALQKRGVRLEVEGDTCRLTMAGGSPSPANVRAMMMPRQCHALPTLRGDKAYSLCETTCSAVPFCEKLRSPN
jgi:hypothetical protein